MFYFHHKIAFISKIAKLGSRIPLGRCDTEIIIVGGDWGRVHHLRPGHVLQVRQPLSSSAESNPPSQEHQEEDQGEEQESRRHAAIL